jgi:hypothetical protein
VGGARHFKRLLRDFSRVCRRENSKDCLC